MAWLMSLFFGGHETANAVAVLALVAVLGLAVGEIKIGTVKLGIAGPLFVGIGLGHLGFKLDMTMLGFARDFGLLLFVYAIGITVGPGFFQSFKKDGLLLNLATTAICVLGALIAVLIHVGFNQPLEAAVGLFSGAVTNTPSLAAGMQMLGTLGATAAQVTIPPLGYAVAYPFGVIGILITMALLRNIFRVDVRAEAESFVQLRRAKLQPIKTMSIEIRKPELEGRAIHDIPCVRSGGVVIAAVRHADSVHTGGGADLLELKDVVLAVGPQAKLEQVRDALGVEAPARLQDQPGKMKVINLVATRTKYLGKPIFELHFLDAYGVIITRLNRAGVELVPDKTVKLQFGDFLTCVGEEDKLKAVADMLGNERKVLLQAQIIPIFIGFLLGAILGAVPFFIPGLPVPIQLGLAGGPVIVAIILSYIGSIGPLVWFMPPATTNAIREIGITIFMSAVGIYAGPHFVSTVLSEQGLEWMALAALITFIPLFTVGVVLRGVFKVNYLTVCGALAGSCTDPPALAFATAIYPSESQATAYAAVYPLTMFLRIITPQVILALLWAAS